MARSVRGVAVVALCALAFAACGSSTKSSRSTSTTNPRAAEPAYETQGPYEVGFTMLHLADGRDVAVWYPADATSVVGKKKATYDQAEPLPANLKGLVPAKYDAVVTMNAYTDVPASKKGAPYPVVLFSHGLSSYALENSGLLAGIASWGFIVVSPEYTEYGIVNQVTHKKPSTDPNVGKRVMLAGLDLVTKENTRAGSLLNGIVDSTRVAAVGHSMGGNTAFNALNDPRVKVAVGWAPEGPSGKPANKPTMIIGMQGDIIFTPAALMQTFNSFAAPKRLVELGSKTNSGHNSFSDSCVVIRNGAGLIEFARANHLVPDALLALGLNGCRKTDISPEKFWPVVQHFTVAEIRDALGIDKPPVGLGDGITNEFPGIDVSYTRSN